MLRRWVLAVFLALTATFICTTSSAATLPKLQTRVGGFDVAPQTLVGPAAARSLGNRRAKSLTMYKCASDPRLGVYDMRARWWSPRLGTFLSADAFRYASATTTLWGWPGQNPYRWYDPTGHYEGEGSQYSGLDYALLALDDSGALYGAQNFFAGVSSAATFGLSDIAFSAAGVDNCTSSGAYGAGSALTQVALAAASAGALGIGGGAREIASTQKSAIALAKELASESQLAEMVAGEGEAFAGAGTQEVFRDADRIAATYGGDAADWAKMSSSSFTAADGTNFSTHWLENVSTGQQVEPKVVIDVFGGP